jgi:ribosome-associated toxin RatA of RatAB toxin-antitoxin module
MKWILISILSVISLQVQAQDSDNPFNVQISIKPVNSRFHINANYTVPITPCNAYAFLTDYEASKNIAGIKEVKILSRSANKVRVSRTLEEEILFFHIELKTVVEYTEVPYNLLTFEKVSGDVKYYKGTWKIVPDKDKTTIQYDADVELDSIVPMVVIEYFMKNNLFERLESMAQKATQYKSSALATCK